MINPYVPTLMAVENIIQETDTNDIKTFEVTFRSDAEAKHFNYKSGQYAMLSIFGVGECPIGFASSSADRKPLQFTVKRMGTVTTALHHCEKGSTIGMRGPYGNGWPLEAMEGGNVLIVGGGYAFTTLRALAKHILHADHRKRFGTLTIIYGARSPNDLIYKYDLEVWKDRDDLALFVTVDKGDTAWKGLEGYVPTILGEVAPESKNAVAALCGPPIMIKYTIPILIDLGFPPEKIMLSLEMRMKCGIGKCGRCNIGDKYVCKDGPVFTYRQLQQMPKEY